MRKPWIRHQPTAAILGVALFIVGTLLIYDAYDRRGGRPPWFIRAFTPN